MTVKYIKEAKSRGYITLCVASEDSSENLTVSESVYLSLGSPMAGDEITSDCYDRLSLANSLYQATLKALRILSYGDNSKSRLYSKLVSGGIPKSVATETVREMVRLGYLNEDRTLYRLIGDGVNKSLLGRRKLTAKLAAKGYSPSDVSRIIDEMSESGEIDFERSKAALIKKKLPKDASGEEISVLLYKFGY